MKGLIQRRFGCTGLRLRLPAWLRCRWQAELWYCPRAAVIPAHEHPGLVSRLFFLAGGMEWWGGSHRYQLSTRDVGFQIRVPARVSHGARVTGRFGLFLNLERWLPGVPMTSAAEDLKLA